MYLHHRLPQAHLSIHNWSSKSTSLQVDLSGHLAHSRKPCPPSANASTRSQQQQSAVFKEPKNLSRVRADDEDLEIPQAGWLWQTGKKGSSSKGTGPTALSTVANLKANRIKAKRSLGQNFLTDDKVLLDIAKAATVRPGDLVLEVGPGTGNLTKHLLACGAHVTSIEKDDVLFARLSEEYAQEEYLRIVHGDVLRWDVPKLLQEMQQRSVWYRGEQEQQQQDQSQQDVQQHVPSQQPGQQQRGGEGGRQHQGEYNAQHESLQGPGSQQQGETDAGSLGQAEVQGETHTGLQGQGEVRGGARTDAQGRGVSQEGTHSAQAGLQGIGEQQDHEHQQHQTGQHQHTSCDQQGEQQQQQHEEGGESDVGFEPRHGSKMRTTLGQQQQVFPRRLRRLKDQRPPPGPKVKVVANLPYNITKEFLKKMLPMGEYVSELNIMIQQEAAERLVHSTPGSNDFRAMNLFVQLYSQPLYRFRISRFKYDPVPGVDGALVTFKLLPSSHRLQVPGGQGGERKFMQLVYRGFDQRRKMLRNSLQPAYTPAEVEAGLVKIGLTPRARAQELSLEQHVALAHALEQVILGSDKDKGWMELLEGHRCNMLSCEEPSIDEDDEL